MIGAELEGQPPSDIARTRRYSVDILLFLTLLFALLGPLMTAPPPGATAASVAAGNVAVLTGDGNIARQGTYIVLFAALLWTLRVDLDLRRLAVIPSALVIALAYCWLSISWSAAPEIGMRRLALTTLVIVMVSVAVDAIGVERSLRAFRYALVAMLVPSLLAVFLMPELGIHQLIEGEGGDPAIPGMWRGIFPEKNIAGAVAGVTVLIHLFSMEALPWHQRLTAAAAALFFLIGTGSKTSLGLTVIAVLVATAYRFYNPRYWPVVFAVLATGVFVAIPVLQYQWDALTQPFHREDSFTGRTQIWQPLLAYLSDYWWTGNGYGGFWNIGADSPIFHYARTGSWVTGIASAHNGYLDLALQIGVPGLIVCGTALVLGPMARLLSRSNGDRNTGVLLVSLLVFCAGHNALESSLLDRDLFPQVCLVVTLAMQHVSIRRTDSREDVP